MTATARAGRGWRSSLAVLTVGLSVTLVATACSSGGEEPSLPGSVTARILPPIADASSRVRAADRADVVVEGAVSPATQGEDVTLQVRRGGAWADLETAEQDAQGVVTFTAPYRVDGQPQRYRVVAADGARSAQLDAGIWHGKLKFSDEFDGAGLGPFWNHRVQGFGAVGARSCSRSDPTMVRVADGAAAMSVALDPDAPEACGYDGEEYAHRLNANVGTEGAFSFTYGFAAARMKFQQLRGQHSAFWMQPAAGAAQGDPAESGAEIDVIEWFGEKQPSGGLATYVHYVDESGETVKAGGWVEEPDRFGGDWWRKYHVFSVEWSPEGYVFRIDGRVVSTLDEGVSGVAQSLILSNLSSDYELRHLPSESELPQTAYVDWVRVWEP